MGTILRVVLTHFLSPYRLVSAYRDKLERCHSVREGKCDLRKDYYYKKYGKQIVSIFRTKYLDKFGQESLDDR